MCRTQGTGVGCSFGQRVGGRGRGERLSGSCGLQGWVIASPWVNSTRNLLELLKPPKSEPYSIERWRHEFLVPGCIMKKQIAQVGLILAIPLLGGCGMCRSVEQWKCDNWGMCHFAPNRPGVYAPMSVQPTYGPPMAYGSTVAPPSAGMAPATMVPASGAPATMVPASGAGVGSGVTVGNPVNTGCKDCNR